MVAFGKQLRDAQHGPWRDRYLDYNALKLALTQIGDPVLENDHNSERLPGIEVATDNTADFENMINNQVEKVVLFFLEKQGDLAKRLADLRAIPSQERNVLSMTLQYEKIGRELLLLVNFVDLNVTGLRKILKKHDKRFHLVTSLSEQYMKHYAQGKDGHLQQMYHYGGIASLAETLRRGMDELEEPSLTKCHSISTGSIHAQPILNEIYIARLRLQDSSSYAQAMAAHELILDYPSHDDDHSMRAAQQDRQSRQVSSNLNLLSTFLYMTNYYIVAPTSGDYASKLGMSKALSGAIIGMTPCAALVASVLYSWWSNHSYKNALLFGAMCSITGDLLYALALPLDSVALVFLGRLLNGFGGVRAVNRRYIADAFSKSERTSASAAFVTAGALGMAAGPFLAVLTDQIIAEEGEMECWWTTETAPGWIMFVLWIVFLLLATFYFEEPERVFRKEMELPQATNEEQPLLQSHNDNNEKEAREEPSQPLYKNFAVMVTLIFYFILKLVLECLLSSTATVTSFYFGWDITKSGTFLAILGLLVFPANLVVVVLSRRFRDIQIIFATQAMILVGTVGVIAYYRETYTVIQYVGFSVLIFLGSNMLEGPNMALLSKRFPRNLAKGTFNSGLLATEAGTAGRVVGDFVISAAGLVGLERILDLTFLPAAALAVLMLAVTWCSYDRLDDGKEDDDD